MVVHLKTPDGYLQDILKGTRGLEVLLASLIADDRCRLITELLRTTIEVLKLGRLGPAGWPSNVANEMETALADFPQPPPIRPDSADRQAWEGEARALIVKTLHEAKNADGVLDALSDLLVCLGSLGYRNHTRHPHRILLPLRQVFRRAASGQEAADEELARLKKAVETAERLRGQHSTHLKNMADYDRAFMDKARTEGRCTCKETDQWGGPIGCSIHHSPVF